MTDTTTKPVVATAEQLNDKQWLLETLELASQAATEAGMEWMRKALGDLVTTGAAKYQVIDDLNKAIVGHMLDLCGNAHVVVSDKRSAFFKALVKHDFLEHPTWGKVVLPIYHYWRHRQEHGLQVACARAALKVLQERGITKVGIWDYID